MNQIFSQLRKQMDAMVQEYMRTPNGYISSSRIVEAEAFLQLVVEEIDVFLDRSSYSAAIDSVCIMICMQNMIKLAHSHELDPRALMSDVKDIEVFEAWQKRVSFFLTRTIPDLHQRIVGNSELANRGV